MSICLDLLSLLDPEQITLDLFARHSVSHLQTLAKQVHSESLQKKEELTELVKEKYRDLLNVADEILAMDTIARDQYHQLSALCYAPNGFSKWTVPKPLRVPETPSPEIVRGAIHELTTLYSIGAVGLTLDLAKIMRALEEASQPLASYSGFHPLKAQIAKDLAVRISETASLNQLLEDLMVMALLQGYSPPEALAAYLMQQRVHVERLIQSTLLVEVILKLINDTLHAAVVLFAERFPQLYAREARDRTLMPTGMPYQDAFRWYVRDRPQGACAAPPLLNLKGQLDEFKAASMGLVRSYIEERIRAHTSISQLVGFASTILAAYKSHPTFVDGTLQGVVVAVSAHIDTLCEAQAASITAKFSAVTFELPGTSPQASLVVMERLSTTADFEVLLGNLDAFVQSCCLGPTARALTASLETWSVSVLETLTVLRKQSTAGLVQKNTQSDYLNASLSHGSPIIDEAYVVVSDLDENAMHSGFFQRVSTLWVNLAAKQSETYQEAAVRCEEGMAAVFDQAIMALRAKVTTDTATLYQLLKVASDVRAKLVRFKGPSEKFSALITDLLERIVGAHSLGVTAVTLAVVAELQRSPPASFQPSIAVMTSVYALAERFSLVVALGESCVGLFNVEEWQPIKREMGETVLRGLREAIERTLGPCALIGVPPVSLASEANPEESAAASSETAAGNGSASDPETAEAAVDSDTSVEATPVDYTQVYTDILTVLTIFGCDSAAAPLLSCLPVQPEDGEKAMEKTRHWMKSNHLGLMPLTL